MITRITPSVTVFTQSGRFLTEDIPKFSYKFSEEEDDVCEITLKSGDPNLPDDPDLQEGSYLIVSWGYLDGPMSKERKVYIFDVTATYDEEGVTLCLYCHELFAQAKMNVVRTKSNKNYPKKKPPLAVPANLKVEIHPDAKKVLETKYDLSNTTELKTEEGVKLVKNVDKKTVKDLPKDEIGDPVSSNGNLSTFQNLKRDLDRIPGGPYVMDSRDDYLRIRPRNYNQRAVKSYTYKGENGDLLQFSPETKHRSKAHKSEKVNVTSWNAELKEAYNQFASADNSKDPIALAPTGFEILQLMIPTVRPSDERNWPIAPATPSQSQLSPGAANVLKQIGKKPGDGPTVVNTTSFREKNWGYNNMSTSVKMYGFDIIADDIVGDNQVSSSSDFDSALAEATSSRKNAENEKCPATALVIGEPSIESGRLLTFLNVSKKFSGNYYLSEVEHNIDSSGYFTSMTKMGRQGTNKTKKKTKQVTNSEPTYYADDGSYPYPENDDQLINTEEGPVGGEQSAAKVKVTTRTTKNS